MHAKNFVINQGCNRQAVEAISEDFPKFNSVSTLALIVKTVNSINRCTLMVSTKQEEVFWILDLVCKQETHGLERLLSTVNIVAKEKIVGVWRESAVFKQSKQVIILSMNVAADFYGRFKLEQNRLGNENLPRAVAQLSYLGL